MTKVRSKRKAVTKPPPKRWRDLTPEDIDQLPSNATGRSPENNETIARFELMVENLRSMTDNTTPPMYQLIEGLEEYCEELEKLLHRDFLQKSAIAKFIQKDDQKRLRLYVNRFVECHSHALMEYVASKIDELEENFRSYGYFEGTDLLMRTIIIRFLKRARGEILSTDSSITPEEWTYFSPRMNSPACKAMLPQLEMRINSVGSGHWPASPPSYDAYEPSSPEAETENVPAFGSGMFSSLGGDNNPFARSLNAFGAQSGLFDPSGQTDQSGRLFAVNKKMLPESDSISATASEEVPILQGKHWLSNYDYVHHPFPENRSFEIANSRRIDRDLTMPGYLTDGLLAKDLLTTPVAHCRKPGTYTPHVKRRTPLGPYEAVKSLFSWLSTSIFGESELKAQPRLRVGIIPRSVARHKEHNRYKKHNPKGRSGVVKRGKK